MQKKTTIAKETIHCPSNTGSCQASYYTNLKLTSAGIFADVMKAHQGVTYN